MPAQQGPRGEDQAQLAEPAGGHQPGQRGHDCPAGPRQPRCLDLPLEDGDLVAQNQDLSVHSAIGPGKQREQGEHAQHRQAGEPHRHEHRQGPAMRLPRSQMLNLTALSPT
jgi:hypothetical protein